MQKWFTTKEIKKNIWGIGEFMHPEEVISWLVVGYKKALLFDTGLGLRNIKQEIEKITHQQIIVLNSHSHYDHVGGNKFFSDLLNPLNQKKIKLDPFIFNVIRTPGHSPDSICIYEKEKRWLFSGDTLYPAPIYLHLKESSLKDYKKSIKKLLKLNLSYIFPGHDNFSFPINNIKNIYHAITSCSNLPSNIKIDGHTSLLIKKQY